MRRAVLVFARSPRAEALSKHVPDRVFRDVIDAWRRASRACRATAIVTRTQRGATFGERLANAAADAFAAGFDTLLVTGIDTPPVPDLERAFAAVESRSCTAAIAPSTDGGVNAIIVTRAAAAILASFAPRDPHLAARCIDYFAGRVLLLASSTDIDSPDALRRARCEAVWRGYFTRPRFATTPAAPLIAARELGIALRAPPLL